MRSPKTSKRHPSTQASDARARLSGMPRAPRRPPDTARRWVIWMVVGATLVMGGSREVSAQPPGVGQDVCARTHQVQDAIVSASGATHCADVTLRHIREITSLDLSGENISSLSVGDFDGLVRLDTLDLSGNHLTALPQGVFDELLLLKRLRLNGNNLGTVPADLFDELFLLEELALQDNPSLALPAGIFPDFSQFDGMSVNGTQPDNSG